METKEIIFGIAIFIPLILAIIYLPKFIKNFSQTPNMKLNYIIGKYRLKTYSAEDLENLLKENDSKVPKRDKDLIKELLKEEYSL